MTVNLMDGMRTAGLIQFGAFGDDPQAPVQFKLELMASYPAVLETAAEQLAAIVAKIPSDRLLCLPDAVPLATLVSQRVSRALVYSQFSERGSLELIGAYDIGHPTVLIANVLHSLPTTLKVIDYARRVGLDVRTAAAVLYVGEMGLGGEATCLITLREVIDNFVAVGALPKGQSAAVHLWMQDFLDQ